MRGLSGSFPTNPHYKPPYWISVGIGAAYVMRPPWSLSCYTFFRPFRPLALALALAMALALALALTLALILALALTLVIIRFINLIIRY